MLWLIPVIILAVGGGLAAAFLLHSRRSEPVLPHRNAPLEDSLPDYLKTLAARPLRRAPVPLRPMPRLQSKLDDALYSLSCCIPEQLLPASDWLNNHGRMLQEEAAALCRSLKHASPLPAFADGESRIGCFARVFFAHNDARLSIGQLKRAVEAWQQQAPFTVRELEALLSAMKNALITLLCTLAQQCAGEQRILTAVEETIAHLEKQQEKQALRLFEQNRHHRLYLSRLTSRVRKAPEGDAALWMRQLPLMFAQPDEQLTEEERVHQSENVRWASNAIASLRQLDRLPWDKLLEEWSLCHQLFLQDAVYASMDSESRAHYRLRAGEISRLGVRSEQAVCEACLNLCSGYPADDVRAHIGYYLLDDGLPLLLQTLRLRPGLLLRWRFGLQVERDWRFLCAVILAGVLAIFVLAGVFPPLWLPAAFLLCASLTRLIKPIVGRQILPRMVPRLALSALPDEARTLVVCPVMLLDPAHALKAVRQLSILQKANPDPNLHFLLLGDHRDSMAGSLAADEEIISTAAAAIRALRDDTGHPFFYFHRERVYHLADHVHMSRERKRGGLETLMKLMEGEAVEDTFAYASIQPERLAGQYRYLITLDGDTLLPPGAALQLVGAMLHPLQKRRPLGDHMRGISILQPRMCTAMHMAQTSLSRLLGEAGGMDAYHALHHHFDQDVRGEAAFQGKGIIDPKAFLKATAGQIIPGAVLSHDLLEGLLGGCALAGDITLYEGQPETIQGHLTRLHRWTRGDWQLLPYLVNFLPKQIRPERNALRRQEKRRIWQVLGLSLLRPLQLLTVVFCVVFRQPWLLIVCLLSLDISALWSGRQGFLRFLVQLAILPAQAMIQLDAIGRTLYRLVVSRQKLLEWITAAELSRSNAKTDMRFFYLSMAAAGSLALMCILPGALRLPGIALAAFWAAAPFAIPALESPKQTPAKPTGYMQEVLLRLAKSTLLFFETAITTEDHGLPPDNVQIDPNKGIAHRTSPTNIGLYLCALISAQRLELLTADELAQRIRPAVEAMEKMQKWNGHLMNWYDTRTLEPLKPRFISTVDSGNLAVCLTTAAQGMRCLLKQLPEYDHDLPARMDDLAQQMQFQPLYDEDADLFRIGYDLENKKFTDAHYDLLASESRLGSFYTIMTGQVPLRHWFRLARVRVHTRKGQTLLSGSGTMFEYLMPFLFQPPASGTLLTETARSAIHVQYAHQLEGISGVSESGYYAFDPNLLYQYKAFGLTQLALDPQIQSSVIAPYATLLALGLEPKASFANLLHMQSLGMEGPLGLFEAADFDPARIGGEQPMRLIHSHMAHHQGMILCAICNFLCDNALAGLFFHLPGAQAYRLLLEEPMRHLKGVLKKPLRRVSRSRKQPDPFAAHPIPGLQFPINAHVLHGAGTTLLVDAQGGGYMSRNGIMLTRFHPECHLPSGLRLYIKDSQTGQYWQAADPSCEAVFETAQAVFQLTISDIASSLRVFVDPLSGMAVHALTIENRSQGQRMLEVCSYLEPALFPQRDMEAHPAYRKLFLETDRLGNYGVSVTRRPASPEETELRLWHALTADTPFSVFHIQTDRCAFIGRGGTLYAPRELGMPLSSLADAVGAMIDPCLSLRGQFVLQPGSTARLIFVTGCPKANENPSAFLLHCDQPDSVLGWYDAALTQALVTAQVLDLSPEEQGLLYPVAGLMAYTGQPSQSRYADGNSLPLQALWPLNISGDLPLLTLECHDQASIADASLLLRLHAYCRMSGLWFDLALICREDSKASVFRSLEDAATRSHSHDLLGQSGGVHLFDPAHLAPEHRTLLMAAAQLYLCTVDGSVAQQLAAMHIPAQSRPLYRQNAKQAWTLKLPPTEKLMLENGFGGFTQEEGNYVITLPPGRQTPAPWCNPLCNEHFGTLAGESGLLFSYAGNSSTGRLTRWPNDSVNPIGEENLFLRDENQRLLWSLTRQPLGMGLAVRITHAPGETTYESSGYGILSKVHCFTDPEYSMGLRVIQLKNEDSADRILTFCHAMTLTMDHQPSSAQLFRASRLGGGLCMENPQLDGVCGLCAIEPEASILTSMSAGAFYGIWGVAPAALSSAELPSSGGGNTAMLCLTVQLKPGESKTIITTLAFGHKRSDLARMFQKIRISGASKRLHQTKQLWEHRLAGMLFDLPDRGLSLLLNRWLPYQVRAARLMMKGALYQAGGAIGFRDQLQDMLSLVHTERQQVRNHLLLCAAHQFEQGDVQHWWLPDGSGVRTRISDDLLFLPFVTAVYVHSTGDRSILAEQIPWLSGDALKEDENERFFTPQVTSTTASLQEHCLRAIFHTEQGSHGLPAMGSGDWNDGLNRVEGESVWLGMFLCEVLRRFAPLCDASVRKQLEDQRSQLLERLDRYAWDGGWYLRCWYPDGTPMGSQHAEQCRIDILPQSWAVLCGVSRDRCQAAMENVWRMLYQKDIGILKLFTPPFDGDSRPGYLSGYLPGIRENGGQYTHAVPWAIAAFHQLGQDDRAWELALSMLPIRHSSTQQLARRYRVEPYVLAGDLYAHPQQRGRGGWTWYTGSAAWYLTVITEQLLGFQKEGDQLRFRPVLPKGWDEIHLRYRYGSATYHLHANRECVTATADGQVLTDNTLRLQDDGRIHEATFPAR